MPPDSSTASPPRVPRLSVGRQSLEPDIIYVTPATNGTQPPPPSLRSSTNGDASDSTQSRSSPARSRSKKKKTGSSVLSLFTLKEPSANALEHYAKQQFKQAQERGGAPIPAGIPGVSSSRLPADVPKVNSKWDGLPESARAKIKASKSSNQRNGSLDKFVRAQSWVEGSRSEYSSGNSVHTSSSGGSKKSAKTVHFDDFPDPPRRRPYSPPPLPAGHIQEGRSTERQDDKEIVVHGQVPWPPRPVSGHDLPEMTCFLPSDIPDLSSTQSPTPPPGSPLTPIIGPAASGAMRGLTRAVLEAQSDEVYETGGNALVEAPSRELYEKDGMEAQSTERCEKSAPWSRAGPSELPDSGLVELPADPISAKVAMDNKGALQSKPRPDSATVPFFRTPSLSSDPPPMYRADSATVPSFRFSYASTEDARSGYQHLSAARDPKHISLASMATNFSSESAIPPLPSPSRVIFSPPGEAPAAPPPPPPVQPPGARIPRGFLAGEANLLRLDTTDFDDDTSSIAPSSILRRHSIDSIRTIERPLSFMDEKIPVTSGASIFGEERPMTANSAIVPPLFANESVVSTPVSPSRSYAATSPNEAVPFDLFRSLAGGRPPPIPPMNPERRRRRMSLGMLRKGSIKEMPG